MFCKLKRTLVHLVGSIRSDKSSRVLYYHDVHTVDQYSRWSTHASLMQRHFDTIRQCGYTIVDNITEPKGQVMICFDDGYRGVYVHRQLFIDNNVRPTVFVTAANIGKEGFLTVDEIKTLQSVGFDFQCHTYTHADLWHLSESELDHELGDSKAEIERKIGSKIDAICFPRGLYSDKVIDIAEKHGYTRFFSCSSYPFFKEKRKGLISRYLIQSASTSHIKDILSGGEDWLHSYYIHKQKA